MNAIPSPSSPPPLVRQGMPISAMKLRPLPRHSREEIEVVRRLFHGYESPRQTRCAGRCWTITREAALGGGR